MNRGLIFSLLVLVGLSGCNKPESPEFKYLENVQVNIESLSSANLHADAVLFNPNKNTITIRKADIDIMLEDKVVAILDKEFDLKVKGQEEFTIPLDVKIKLKDLNLNAISSALGLSGSDGQEIRYVGNIKIKAYGVPFTVRVDYKDKIKLKI